jgi:dihydropyrimidinase/dihydroorotase
MTDRRIENARIVDATGVRPGSIAIDDGRIAAVGPDVASDGGDADDVIDADGMVALPGMVDVHNHMHDPELFPEGIDFASETASAAAGGVTTVV